MAKQLLKYISDEMHHDVVIRDAFNVNTSLQITTANLKSVYVLVKKERISIVDELHKLVDKGVKVEILCSQISPAFLERLSKYDRLIGNYSLLTIKQCRRIHMKMIIYDHRKVYLGSANITNAAVGGERKNKERNFEAGILTNIDDIVQKAKTHFRMAWNDKICDSCECCDICGKRLVNKKEELDNNFKPINLD